MSQLGRRYETTRVFIEVAQPFDEVICRISGALLRDGLVYWQEHLKRYSLVWFQLHGELLHIRLSRILAQGAQTLANLLLLDLSIAAVVEQIESLLEFWNYKKQVNKRWEWLTYMRECVGYVWHVVELTF